MLKSNKNNPNKLIINPIDATIIKLCIPPFKLLSYILKNRYIIFINKKKQEENINTEYIKDKIISVLK